jgi:tRNA-Thr(GGU) m(6)t(6)A37 methyltransferase TsaA
MDEMIEMRPVGYVENTFHELKYNENMYQSVSKIIIYDEFKDGLYRVTDFDRLEVIFYFDKFNNYELIQKRRIDGVRAGVFASRTPKRPNGIGITTVKLEKVVDNILHVKGLDALDKTPVLDIKPYVESFKKGPD